MPLSYKNITITPNTGQNADPTIAFQGANANVNTIISLYMYPDSNGFLSFEGSAGQLFSITNDLTNVIFSVNDVSGIPSLEVYANGLMTLASFGGNVAIGNTARLVANGSPGIAGQVLTSNATGVYWANASAGVNTALSYTWTNTHIFQNTVTYSGFSNTRNLAIRWVANTSSNSSNINLNVYPDTNGALSFEGSAGQLFSITNDLSGSLFAVSDSTGLPLIEVNVTSRQITFGQFYGNVSIGLNASNSSPFKLDCNGSANISGVVRDSKGDTRDIPATDRTASMPYTITIGDTGKMVLANGNTSSTSNVFIPNNVFFTGNTVMIVNQSTNNVTVTQNSGVTMFLAGSTSTGNRTLSGKGIATVLCVGANNFIISGAGLF